MKLGNPDHYFGHLIVICLTVMGIVIALADVEEKSSDDQ